MASAPHPGSVRPPASDGQLDRRTLLATGGLALSSCGALGPASDPGARRLDQLLEAHADALPENVGGGANHYPMAAEVLAEYGQGDRIDGAWIEGASLYGGDAGRVRPLQDGGERTAALGHYGRYGDWLDHFRGELQEEPWPAVVARWVPRFAPGISAAAYHGVIRTGHAVRALRRRDTPARRDELGVGLAYWAARYVELPTTDEEPRRGSDFRGSLAELDSPWLGDHDDVDFFAVGDRLTQRAVAPRVAFAETGASARADLEAIVHETATAFLEMLVQERHRIWLLHTVTGPAALDWLLPEVAPEDARRLVEYARQSVVAMYVAYGAPFAPRAHVEEATSSWGPRIQRAVDSGSVHGIKLIDALVRFDRDEDPLWRSVADRWFLWT